MMFTNEEQRENLFRQLKHNPEAIRLGAALRHARDTNLGLWGDVATLQYDCAVLMAAEVRQLCRERGQDPHITAREVLRTEAFRLAFESAREEQEVRLGRVLEALGRESGNQVLAAAGAYECGRPHRPVDLERAAEQVLRELVTHGVIAQGRRPAYC